MTPLTPLDHLLAFTLAVFFPIRSATFGYRRLAEASEDAVPRIRRSLYRQTLVIQWTLAVSVIALWITRARPWDALGLLWHTRGLSWALVAATVLAFGILAYRYPRTVRDPAAMALVRKRLAGFDRLMPRSIGELRMFYAVSLTAGVCEELLYRGFMIDYLRHAMPLLPAAAIAVVVFGLGHSYQGVGGVLKTGVLGGVLAAFYMISGSLFVPMALHAGLDAYSGTLGRQALNDRPAPAATAGG